MNNLERTEAARMYRCKCERGYVRCYQQVAKRGSLCNDCTGQPHTNGYHAV